MSVSFITYTPSDTRENVEWVGKKGMSRISDMCHSMYGFIS